MIGRRTIQWWLLLAFPLQFCGGETPHYTLTQCVNLVLERNPEAQAARKRLQEAAGAIVEARAGYLPNLTASANYLRVERDYANLSDSLPDRRPELWNVAIRLTENLYSGGATGGRMQIARLNEKSRLLEYEATLDRIIMDTRLAFYEILRNRTSIAVHQEAIAFLESELQNQRNRLQVGNGDRLRTLRAEVSLSLERAALLEAENQLGNSYVRLGELLSIPVRKKPGAGLDVAFEIAGDLAYAKQTLDLNTCLAKALELRPEMKVRANDLAVQKQQLVVDRSTQRPRLDAFVGYDFVNEPDAASRHDTYNGYVVGISLSWQLFDGFLARGKMSATRARISQAEFAQEAMQNAIQADVVRAFHDLELAEQIIQTQQKNVALAEESLQLAKANLDLGVTTQLELLQARVDLTRARTTELAARFTWNAALARLQRAISSQFTILQDTPRPAAKPQP